MKLNPFSKKKRRRSRRSTAKEPSSGWLSPYAKKAIFGIILIIVALIALLSFINEAGPLGEGVQTGLQKLFGWLGYAAPFGLIALGGYLIWPQKLGMEKMRVIGLAITIIGLLGLLHIFGASADDALQAAHEGTAGGYLGFLLSFPLSQALSRVAATLIFLGALCIGLILTFRISPTEVWEKLVGSLADRKEDGDEEAEENETQQAPRFRVNPIMRAPDTSDAKMPSEQTDSAKVTNQRSVGRRYRPAILKLLHESSSAVKLNKDEEKSIKETIRRTFEHFGVQVEMGEATVGPTVTQYTLRPEEGIKLSRITALQDDLALALAAHPLRIEAPIPNTSLVGIEIPNKAPSIVRLRDLLTSKAYKNSESPLSFPLGLDVSGDTIIESLDRLPHLLIAGATGAGKSVSIHALLIAWLFRNSPDTLKLILVDPKRVELPPYNGIPHLLTPVIVDTEKTKNALNWAIEEMELRYRLLEDAGCRNLPSFNLNNPTETKPYLIIVIDELADLMGKHARDIEGPIVRLSQMARAVGIHLVLATQRPSVNVLTGLIKANIPARVAFTVASQIDSRTILDMAGAEKLVGRGDMLYLAGDKARPVRIQGGFVSEEEVRDVVEVIKASGEPEYDETIVAATHGGSPGTGGTGGGGDADDPLFEEAKNVILNANKASASLLQRRLRVGYARAARLLDTLEEQQIIGAAEGNKPRQILIQAGEEKSAPSSSLPVEQQIEIEDEDNQNERSNSEDKW